MKEILKFLIPYWKRGIIPILFLIVSTSFSFVYPLFPKWAIDNIIEKRKIEYLIILSIIFISLITLQKVFAFFNEITFFKFQKRTILDIQKVLIKKVFYYPLDFFDKNHSGYLMGRIRGDVNGLNNMFSSVIIKFFLDFIKFIGTIIIMFSLNIKLTILTLIIIPFAIIKIRSSQSELEKLNKIMLEENAMLEKELSDTFQGIELLKSCSKEEKGINRTVKALSNYQKIEVERNIMESKYRNVVDFILYIGEVLFFYFGIRELFFGNLSMGAYVAFAGYLIYLYQPIRNLSHFQILFNYSKQSFFKIKELLNILPEDNGDLEIDRINSIEIRNLSFSYTNGNGVIKDLSFKIKSGDKILISGSTGSGKSTLLKLLLGLYRAEKGTIKYNSIDIKKINLKKLRTKVGYISQNIFLFNKSIKENIMLETKTINEKELMKWLEICKLKDKVLKLKNGINHEIQEKGGDFSGGEKQKIALVRALIKNPEIIILDEGTSNIDESTEKEILSIIEKQMSNKIIIRVTHRNIDKKKWKQLILE